MDEFHTVAELFDQSNYKLVKALSQLTGQWPYRNKKTKICFTMLLIVSTIQITSQILAVIHYHKNPDIVIAAIPPFLIDIACIVKMFNLLCNFKKIKELLEWMREDWINISNEEKKILQKYANIGKWMTTGYSGIGYVTGAFFVLEPTISDMIAHIMDSNYTTPEEGIYPVPMFFGGINVDKVHYLTLIISYFNCIAVVSIAISNDILFIVYMQHICGRFAGLGHKMKNLPIPKPGSKDNAFKYIGKCIVSHHRLINFAETLDSIYKWSFLVVLGCNMMIVSMTAVQAATQANSIQSAMKLFMFASSQVMHLFFECFMSQQLMNHSTYIRKCIYDASWYKYSLKTQKLLILMLMRSQIPCRLTAGKIVEMSMETFSSILRTSVSCFTLFRSMQ